MDTREKTFCESKAGILVEIKGPKDQKNVVDMLKEVGEGDEVNYILLESEWLYNSAQER